MNTTINFHTLGCRLNQSETASLQNDFEAHGYSVVSSESPSDIAVINTCTVTEGGDADTRRIVYRLNRLNPDIRIALVGCQAQVQKQQLNKLPNVRWIVGNERKMQLTAVFREYPHPHEAVVVTPTIQRASFTQTIPSVDRQHTRANLKIQDGCDFFCSFCEIPYARGRARSRVFRNVLDEAAALVQAGHKELILTGINIGTYRDEQYTINHILDALEQLQGLERVRISSIEPTTLDFSLITRMADDQSKLCRYLHLPLQSGHDEQLQAMKRLYTTQEFSEFICKVHATVKDICIGTDVIVGFPGETQEHYQETHRNIEHWPIDYVHVFSYSPRQMAVSRKADDAVDRRLVSQRSQQLRALSLQKREAFYHSQLGKIQTVLIEQRKDQYWTGWTDNYIKIKIKSDRELHNTLISVKLVDLEEGAVRSEFIHG